MTSCKSHGNDYLPPAHKKRGGFHFFPPIITFFWAAMSVKGSRPVRSRTYVCQQNFVKENPKKTCKLEAP